MSKITNYDFWLTTAQIAPVLMIAGIAEIRQFLKQVTSPVYTSLRVISFAGLSNMMLFLILGEWKALNIIAGDTEPTASKFYMN